MDEYDYLENFEEDAVIRTYRPYFNAFEELDDRQFARRFRFSKDGVRAIADMLRHDLRRVSRRKCTVSPEMQIMVALKVRFTVLISVTSLTYNLVVL